MIKLLAEVRTAIWAAAAVRVLVAVILLFAPQLFPMRDYTPATVDPEASLGQRMANRPQMFPLAEDELAYDELARSIVKGDGYVLQRGWVITQPGQPTAYGGALYPLFVAIVYGVTGNLFPAVVAVQILLSVWAVAGLARIGATVGGNRTAVATAWLAAVHPGLAMAPSLLMTEALSIPIVVGVVVTALRWLSSKTRTWAVATGLFVGTAFLVRSPLGLMGATVATVVVLLLARRQGAARALQQISIAAVSAAVVMAPWTARNWVQYHRFLPLDTKSGVNLWMYNRPPGTAGWTDITGMNEGEVDAMYRRRARQNLVEHPGWFARTTLARGLLFWWPVPRSVGTPAHWAGVGLYAGITACTLLGIVILIRGLPSQEPNWLVLLPLLVGWGLMAITTSGLRHRLTVEPLIVLGAAQGIVFLVSTARDRRAARSAPQV